MLLLVIFTFTMIISNEANGNSILDENYSNEYNEMFGLREEPLGEFPEYMSYHSDTSKTSGICAPIKECECWSYKRGWKIECINASLTKFPNNLPKETIRLSLLSNKITQLDTGTFYNFSIMTFLDISNNHISKLTAGIFNGLKSLQTLILRNNRIHYDTDSISKYAFQSLDNLTYLAINQDLSSIWLNESYPIEALIKLKRLHVLQMDGLPNTQFPKEFSKMTKLSQLYLSGNGKHCSLEQISYNTFENITQIQRLIIQNCNLKCIENGSFENIKHLQELEISYNIDLHFKHLPNITYGLQTTNLTKLNLTKIHPTFGECTKLTASMLEYLYNTNIKFISLDSNRLSYIEEDAVRFIPRTLRGISIKDNKIILGNYILLLLFNMNRIFSNIRIFIMAEQRVNHDIKYLYKDYNYLLRNSSWLKILRRSVDTAPVAITIRSAETPEHPMHIQSSEVKTNSNTSTDIEQSKCDNCAVYKDHLRIIPLPLNMWYLDMSDIKMKAIFNALCVCEPNDLQVFKNNKNNYWFWQGPLVGVTKLNNLQMSENSCQRLSPTLLSQTPNLEKVNMSKNFIGFMLNNDQVRAQQLFAEQRKLKSLDLTENKIRNIPYSLFSNLVMVEHLYLGLNEIVNLNADFSNMKRLKYVDLRSNRLHEISESVRQHFDKVSQPNNLTVNFAYNEFKCNCKHLSLLKWLSETSVVFEDIHKYNCKFDNDTFGNLSSSAGQIYRSLSYECTNYTVIIMATSFSIMFVLSVAICGIVYRYRWDMRYMYYSTKFRFKGYTPLNMEDDDFEYDVFVSYSDKDIHFVRQISTELEVKRNLKVLIHDRDFIAGNFVNDNIMKAITTSRKTLIIMSRHFLASNWCRYEMNMARMEGIKTGRDVICIVKKEEVPTSGLPLEILDMMRQQTYIDVPAGIDRQQQFLDRLHTALTN